MPARGRLGDTARGPPRGVSLHAVLAVARGHRPRTRSSSPITAAERARDGTHAWGDSLALAPGLTSRGSVLQRPWLPLPVISGRSSPLPPAARRGAKRLVHGSSRDGRPSEPLLGTRRLPVGGLRLTEPSGTFGVPTGPRLTAEDSETHVLWCLRAPSPTAWAPHPPQAPLHLGPRHDPFEANAPSQAGSASAHQGG